MVMLPPTLSDDDLDCLFKKAVDGGQPVDGVILAATYDDIQILHVSLDTKPTSSNELCLKTKQEKTGERRWKLVSPLYFRGM
jgi:hypothetical protein